MSLEHHFERKVVSDWEKWQAGSVSQEDDRQLLSAEHLVQHLKAHKQKLKSDFGRRLNATTGREIATGIVPENAFCGCDEDELHEKEVIVGREVDTKDGY